MHSVDLQNRMGGHWPHLDDLHLLHVARGSFSGVDQHCEGTAWDREDWSTVKHFNDQPTR